MADGTWGLAEAKAKLSEVIDKALTEGPQRISRRGKDTVVLVTEAAWESRGVRRENLADFLARSPLRGSGLKIEPIQGGLRDVDL